MLPRSILAILYVPKYIGIMQVTRWQKQPTAFRQKGKSIRINMPALAAPPLKITRSDISYTLASIALTRQTQQLLSMPVRNYSLMHLLQYARKQRRFKLPAQKTTRFLQALVFIREGVLRPMACLPPCRPVLVLTPLNILLLRPTDAGQIPARL